ncbi:MAG: 50S ribosomal protein L18 [Deltaproteobacteria bacterium]|nr:50S ribosomal protein L18 [Deltaproteobacteria bacterium]
MINRKSRKDKRQIRHIRIKKSLKGSFAMPRLCVFKSSRHIYGQIIDDSRGHTIVAASSLTPKVRELINDKKKKTEISALVGMYIGKLALSKGIKRVCFDRGGYPFHGRVKSFAEAAREAGLSF